MTEFEKQTIEARGGPPLILGLSVSSFGVKGENCTCSRVSWALFGRNSPGTGVPVHDGRVWELSGRRRGQCLPLSHKCIPNATLSCNGRIIYSFGFVHHLATCFLFFYLSFVPFPSFSALFGTTKYSWVFHFISALDILAKPALYASFLCNRSFTFNTYWPILGLHFLVWIQVPIWYHVPSI